jgi:membrane protease YdiL (CAAX protease family)
MSISSTLLHSSSTSVSSSEELTWRTALRENIGGPTNWLYLIPTIGAVALCVFLAPVSAPMGIATGVAILIANAGVSILLKVTNLLVEDENSEYEKSVLKFPFLGTVVAPVLEEGIFRGLLQPLATRAILWIVPTAAALCFGTGLSVAMTVSIVATGAIFGLAHSFNDHKNAHIQAVLTTFGGIAFGLIAGHYGLIAAITAHIINNTIAITFSKLIHKAEPSSSLSPVT